MATRGQTLSSTFAVIAGKLSASAIRIAGMGLATNLPGKISRKISPSVLASIASQSRQGVVAVSGTNGKSTTSGLVASILREAKMKIVHNRQGANLVTGITATLVEACAWNGQLDADYCLFEIDEAALPIVASEVKIKTIAVTNLFRDQLDRFGELDTTAKLITKGIKAAQSKAVLNADDPNVAQMVPECDRLFYGVASIAPLTCGDEPAKASDSNEDEIPEAGIAELSSCTACGAEYLYSLRFYGQLGHYRCGDCGQTRPTPQVLAEDVTVVAAKSTFTLVMPDGQRADVELPLPGMFNVYNALCAAALCHSMGIPTGTIQLGLSRYSTLFGRSERISYRNKSILIQLIKNPAGASQAVRAAATDPDGRILIAINDNYADGRDVSWLWDAEFEQLAGCNGPFVVSGLRCHDMAIRLKYAGVASDNIIVEPSLEIAVDKATDLLGDGQTLWLLPTYTCLLELQRILKSKGVTLSGT